MNITTEGMTEGAVHSAHHEERQNVLRDLFSTTLASSFGINSLTEAQTSQLMSALVRLKILSAEDTFRLQDQLRDLSAFDRALDRRVERALQSKGIVTEQGIQSLKVRLNRLEVKA